MDLENNMTITTDKIDLTKRTVEQFLNLLGVAASIEVSHDEDNEAIVIKIANVEESGLLIGNRGRTVNSLQMILSQIINQKDDEWERVLVDIAGWREKEERRLQELAIQTAERVRETGEAQSLFNLNSAERRQIHLSLSKEKDIETRSEGEGKERYLLILLK